MASLHSLTGHDISRMSAQTVSAQVIVVLGIFTTDEYGSCLTAI